VITVCLSVCLCVSVCVCLSVHDHIYKSGFQQTFVCYPWPWLGPPLTHSEMLCTSGFKDDAIFAHNPSLLDVAAQLKRSAHAALGLATNCAQYYQSLAGQRTHGTTFRTPKVTSHVATPGAESAIYGVCLVLESGSGTDGIL